MFHRKVSFFDTSIQQEKIILQKTEKTHLQLLERIHCSESLRATVRDVGKNRPIFFYSNDAALCSSYLSTCYAHAYICRQGTSTQSTQSKHSLGVVIGNGYILSVLPDIGANDILLLDQEPAVHYFILSVRQLILQTNIDDTFDVIRADLITKIKLIENSIKKQATVIDNQINIVDEMDMLGCKHFLANKSRFIQCREALQKKELLPIEINAFDVELMTWLGETIDISKCEISFLNLTNIADYDKKNTLYSCVAQLPLSENFTIVTTQIPSNKQKRKCYVSSNLLEFRESLNPEQETEPAYRLLMNNMTGFLSFIFNPKEAGLSKINSLSASIESGNTY